MNPLDIRKQPTTEATGGSEVRRIKLVENTGGKIETDTFMWALATEALIGMQKMEKRLVSVTVPNTKEWAIAEIELIKVKTNTKETAEGTLTQQNVGEKVALKTSSEKEEERTQNGRGLVTRMATLSCVGSQKYGLLVSVQTKPSTKINSDHTNALRRTSSSDEQSLDPPPGYVPVLLAGIQLPGEKPGSFSTLQSQIRLRTPKWRELVC
ncbi:hypothetical protein PsorP6_001864 [Peronosclerospora sorghi]|uniref:Uncharacterized protein n=1 Tax=Peronosclerospora sorghi TaxID=230839 RepID=A0ACC0WSI5_9STRA|nr:hypothetical protein PsorP6_001864 [Peronosclerospora sorghi]